MTRAASHNAIAGVGSGANLDRFAVETDRFLDERAPRLPEKLANQAPAFRESARTLDTGRKNPNGSSEETVSQIIEWPKGQGGLTDSREMMGGSPSPPVSELIEPLERSPRDTNVGVSSTNEGIECLHCFRRRQRHVFMGEFDAVLVWIGVDDRTHRIGGPATS